MKPDSPFNKIPRSVLLVLLIAVTGFLLYLGWQKWHRTDAWAFVPENAVCIIEAQQPFKWVEVSGKQPAWAQLFSLQYTKTLSKRLDSLRTVALAADVNLDELLQDQPLTVSLHVTARDDFDYLFYVPLQGLTAEHTLNKVIEQFTRHPLYKVRRHTYDGMAITEVYPAQDSKAIFAYIIHDNYLIGSYTPFLVEDAVRTIRDKNTDNTRWNELFERQEKPGDGSSPTVQFYVNISRLLQFTSVFISTGQVDYFRSLPYAAQSGVFTLTTQDEQISLRGKVFTQEREQEVYWLDIFRNQSAGPIRCSKVIPNETAVLYHWSFEDARQLQTNIRNYSTRHDPATVQQQRIAKEKGLRLGDQFDWMGREVALALLEGSETQANRLLFAEAANIDKAIGQLSNLASDVDARNQTPPYIEQYAGTPIRQIGFPELPATLLGNLFEGFPQCFYAPVRGYIVFSNQISTLKQLIDQVAAGNVWAQSVTQQKLLQQNLSPANFTVLIQPDLGWKILQENASTRWKTVLAANAEALLQFDQISMQAVGKGDYYELNLQWNLPETSAPTDLKNRFLVNQEFKFSTPLRTQPFVVKNPQDQRNELLVQDQNYQLHYIASNGKMVGKKPLNSPMVSGAYPVDIYKNGKAQFLFATERQLCLLDRKGFWVSNFPITFPDSVELRNLSVIDYDQSGEYRFVVSDNKGNLYMFDKEGVLLNGWNPRHLGLPLSTPVRHVRIREQDYLIALREDGQVFALNRRGALYPGFPLKLRSQSGSPVFIREGITADQTVLSAVTDYGELIQFDLTGSYKHQEQLVRPSRDAIFELCPDATQKDWVIIRKAKNRIAILNSTGKVLFEPKEEYPQETLCQYYNFGTYWKVFAFTTPGRKETILYDQAGHRIGDRPIVNEFPTSIIYSEAFHKLIIYRSSDNEAGTWTVKVQ